MNGCLIIFLIVLIIGIIGLLADIVTSLLPVIAFLILVFIIWKVYEIFYYKSKKFLIIKDRIGSYVQNCNELNIHIEELKNTYLGTDQLDYGRSEYFDNSKYNYKRPELKKQKYGANIYNCSRTVCDNARQHPFKYICKYFNIKTDEPTLAMFENVLNNFEAAEQGKIILKKEKEEIINNINNEIPFLINKFSKKTLEKN